MDTWVFLSVSHISVLGSSLLLQDEALTYHCCHPLPVPQVPWALHKTHRKVAVRPTTSGSWEETEPFGVFLKFDFIRVGAKAARPLWAGL